MAKKSDPDKIADEQLKSTNRGGHPKQTDHNKPSSKKIGEKFSPPVKKKKK